MLYAVDLIFFADGSQMVAASTQIDATSDEAAIGAATKWAAPDLPPLSGKIAHLVVSNGEKPVLIKTYGDL